MKPRYSSIVRAWWSSSSLKSVPLAVDLGIGISLKEAEPVFTLSKHTNNMYFPKMNDCWKRGSCSGTIIISSSISGTWNAEIWSLLAIDERNNLNTAFGRAYSARTNSTSQVWKRKGAIGNTLTSRTVCPLIRPASLMPVEYFHQLRTLGIQISMRKGLVANGNSSNATRTGNTRSTGRAIDRCLYNCFKQRIKSCTKFTASKRCAAIPTGCIPRSRLQMGYTWCLKMAMYSSIRREH